jgi:hypothetical protein
VSAVVLVHGTTLRAQGYVCSADLSQLVGAGVLTHAFLDELGFAPAVIAPPGKYWSPAQVRQIRLALVHRLIDSMGAA